MRVGGVSAAYSALLTSAVVGWSTDWIRIAASPSGNANTSVAGTTAYSAKPAMEYIQSGVPSGWHRRVSPSYSVPLSRFRAKNVSHRSSRPRAQKRHVPHGMMNAQTTRVPTGGPGTPGPRLSIVPEIS